MAVAMAAAPCGARLAKNKKALFAPANKASLLDQASLIAACPGSRPLKAPLLGRGYVFGLKAFRPLLNLKLHHLAFG
jgi:hypothetical protein